MREILFRGKRVDNGEWVEGTPIESNIDSEGYKSYMFVDYTVKKTMSLKSGHGHFGSAVEIDKDTICQFIGLLDIKGNQIFEGDIIKAWGGYEHDGGFEYNYSGSVAFNGGEFYLNHKNRISISFGNIENYEIIGSIYN